ncbi:MAG: hypothetical protein NTZ09_01255 [Candidatus Hydrogenedentes bacterium]|nr:hypothetical protein [Candidatus Hydrogenedentota bacterium]
MKKMAAGCFAVACVLAVLVALLAGVGYLREERQRELPPMTVQDLDQIATRMSAAAKPAEPQTAPVEVQSKEPHADNLPRRLEKPATDEQRREFFSRGYSTSDKLFGYIGSSPLGAVADAAALIAGLPDGASWERAEAALICGRWAEARSYFEEVVRKSDRPVVQQQAFAFLAWVQDDPEVAARCMELACSGARDACLHFSAELARATGSRELAEHYQSLEKAASAAETREPAK